MLVNAGVSKLSYNKIMHGNGKSEGILMRLFHVFQRCDDNVATSRRLARIDLTDLAILCMLLVITLKWDGALAIYG